MLGRVVMGMGVRMNGDLGICIWRGSLKQGRKKNAMRSWRMAWFPDMRLISV